MSRFKMIVPMCLVFMACVKDSGCGGGREASLCSPGVVFRVEGDFDCDRYSLHCVYVTTEPSNRLEARLILERGQIEVGTPTLSGRTSDALDFDDSEWGRLLTFDGVSEASLQVGVTEILEDGQDIEIVIPILSPTDNVFSEGGEDPPTEVILTIVSDSDA